MGPNKTSRGADPRLRFSQCSGRQVRTRRGPCDQGDENAQRRDDGNGHSPSWCLTTTLKTQDVTNVRQKPWMAPLVRCENV